jgi:hypothetical protein
MIVKKEARYNLIEGIDIHILSNDENHFIEIYNDKKDTSVSMSIDTADLQGLADFFNEYLGVITNASH